MNVIFAFLCIFIIYLLQRHLYHRLWKRNLDLTLAFSESSTREGERCKLYVTVSNRKVLPLPVLRVKFAASRHLAFDDQDNSQISDQFYRNDVLSVMMYQRITRTLDFTCSRRGFYTIDRIDAVGSDLFLSTKAVAVIPSSVQLYVYPRLITDHRFDIMFTQVYGTVLTRRVMIEDPFEFRGIREYQPFDGIRAVNFKASAKTGSLKVNQHAFTASQQVRILLNLEQETVWQYDELLEESIRLASTYACEFIRNGVPTSLASNGRDLQTAKPVFIPAGSGAGHCVTIDEALARIDTKSKVTSFLPILEHIVENPSRNDTLILISTFLREDFIQLIRRLQDEQVNFYWIVPLHEDMPQNIPDDLSRHVFRWATVKQS